MGLDNKPPVRVQFLKPIFPWSFRKLHNETALLRARGMVCIFVRVWDHTVTDSGAFFRCQNSHIHTPHLTVAGWPFFNEFFWRKIPNCRVSGWGDNCTVMQEQRRAQRRAPGLDFPLPDVHCQYACLITMVLKGKNGEKTPSAWINPILDPWINPPSHCLIPMAVQVAYETTLASHTSIIITCQMLINLQETDAFGPEAPMLSSCRELTLKDPALQP